MKIISIDCETTGLDPCKSQLLEVGLVAFDTLVPFKQTSTNSLRIVFVRDRLLGSIFAFKINKDLLNEIANMVNWFKINKELPLHYVVDNNVSTVYLNCCESSRDSVLDFVYDTSYEDKLKEVIEDFYLKNGIEGKLTIAGKNFSNFDAGFLKTEYTLKQVIIDRMHHRVLDIGSMFVRVDDEVIPSLKTCLSRAGFTDEVPHTAVEDAILVIKCAETIFACQGDIIPAPEHQVADDFSEDDGKVISTPDLGIRYDGTAERFGLNVNGTVINPRDNPANFILPKDQEQKFAEERQFEAQLNSEFVIPKIDPTTLPDYIAPTQEPHIEFEEIINSKDDDDDEGLFLAGLGI